MLKRYIDTPFHHFYTPCMARDKIHDAVKNALIKDGWQITHDPYELEFGQVNVRVDLAARKPFAAEKNGRKIAVEIKSFLNRSGIYDFERAVGQYILYRLFLEEVEPVRHLYLAVSDFTYQELFQRQGINFAIRRLHISLVIIRLPREEVVTWID